MKRINFVSSKEQGRISGGYIYNRFLLNGLRDLGYEINSYHSENLANMPKTGIVVIDSIAVNACAKLLEDLVSEPVLLCHLPPEHQVDKRHSSTSDEPVERFIDRCKIVNTGTACLRYMKKAYPSCQQDKLYLVKPGLIEGWMRKENYGVIPRKLLVVSNLIPNKGFEILLDGLEALMELDWSIAVYGDKQIAPEYADELLDRIAAKSLKGRINYHGTVGQIELNRIMVESDMLVQLSPFEPYSMVTLEAVEAGLPVLSSPTGERDDFERTGLTTYLDEPTAQCFLATMRGLLTDPDNYAALRQTNEPPTRMWSAVAKEFDQILSSK